MSKKIKVKPEGRAGIWIPEKESLISFLIDYEYDEIHSYLPAGSMMLGADGSKESVIEEVEKAEQLAILTGSSLSHNMMHSLSVITDNKLKMFDVGEIKESDLEEL